MSKGKLRIRIDSSRDSSAGASAAYILRRLAARAGAYAPGIQEYLFYEIAMNNNGSNLDKVELWLQRQSQKLSYLGYQILAKRTAAPSEGIKNWVEEGMGYRAAVMAVNGKVLYGDKSAPEYHAIGLIRHDETSGIDDQFELDHGAVLVDAYPNRPRFDKVPDKLAKAHFAFKYQTILIFWAGYS